MPSHEGSLQHVDFFLDAATHSKNDNVYYIGPFAKRVSFASQQQRALNLVWALENSDKLRPDSSIAIVGCGLAGLTCAAALIMSGRNPWLFEKTGQVLDLQSESFHRFVHPSINFWPVMDYEPTTVFPVLDWFADDCVNILDGMRKEWNTYFEGEIADIYFNTEVVDIEGSENGANILLATSNEEVRTDFDAVIVATGFGLERTNDMSCSQSYWTLDSLERKRLSNYPEYLVSGCGDGGLIDVLRLVHSNFRNGKLAADFLYKIDSESIRAKVLEFEQKVHYDDAEREPDRAIHRHEGYKRVLSELGRGARKLLDDSLIESGEQVSLVGPLPMPYGDNAAPIYKLMLAHAIEKGAISYVQGRISSDNGELSLTPEGGGATPINPDVYVARHGAQPSPPGLRTAGEAQDFAESQSRIADYFLKNSWTSSIFQGIGPYPPHDTGNRIFANFRLPQAIKCMEKYSASSLHVTLHEDEQSGECIPVYAFDASLEVRQKLPSSLFGIPLIDKPPEVFDEY